MERHSPPVAKEIEKKTLSTALSLDMICSIPTIRIYSVTQTLHHPFTISWRRNHLVRLSSLVPAPSLLPIRSTDLAPSLREIFSRPLAVEAWDLCWHFMQEPVTPRAGNKNASHEFTRESAGIRNVLSYVIPAAGRPIIRSYHDVLGSYPRLYHCSASLPYRVRLPSVKTLCRP